MDLNLGWEIDMTISMLGIDIAKNTFQLHGADNSGKAVHKKRVGGELACPVRIVNSIIKSAACRYWIL